MAGSWESLNHGLFEQISAPFGNHFSSALQSSSRFFTSNLNAGFSSGRVRHKSLLARAKRAADFLDSTGIFVSNGRLMSDPTRPLYRSTDSGCADGVEEEGSLMKASVDRWGIVCAPTVLLCTSLAF